MRDLLKFITCGSVDDGKSTLIGHILYDSKLLYADQERALELESKVGSRGGEIDYSLLLDGLTEEREQGITIDVAYRYFTTYVRSFIVADTPGHEEYTRNMAVGDSIADLAIILIDAEKGVLAQTRRHARICSIMGIRYFVFAINKMDLVSYEESVYSKIEEEINVLSKELDLKSIKIIPVSATEGDNVTHGSDNMKWYKGEDILSYLENVDIRGNDKEKGFYLPIQRVCRPDHLFRGFQGQIESGEIHVGEEITAFPRMEKACVKKIYVGDTECIEAYKGQAVTIQLDREIDVSRGSVLEKDSSISTSDSVTATLIWMDDAPLLNGGNYFIKLGSSKIPGVVAKILYSIDINTGEYRVTDTLQKNEIGVVKISFTDRITVDRFKDHKTLGELILIDRVSFMTSACGVVEQYDNSGQIENGRISDKSRSASMGQQAVTVIFKKDKGIDRDVLWEVEKKLVLEGRYAYFIEDENISYEEMLKIAEHLNKAGVIVLLQSDTTDLTGLLSDSKTHRIIYESKESDKDAIASFVKKISAYEYDLSKEALNI